MRTDTIPSLPLFASVPRRRREEIGSLADEVAVGAGTVLVRQGDLAHEFFVVLDGEVDVLRDGRHVATMSRGEFFGEIALVGSPFRTATVVARTDARLVVLARREFRTMIRRFPEVASVVLSAGQRRVASTLRAVEARG